MAYRILQMVWREKVYPSELQSVTIWMHRPRRFLSIRTEEKRPEAHRVVAALQKNDFG